MLNGQPPFEVDGHLPRLTEEVVARLPSPPADDFELDMEKEGDDNGWKSVVPKVVVDDERTSVLELYIVCLFCLFFFNILSQFI